MENHLRKYVIEHIGRKEKKFTGYIVKIPTERTIDGKKIWVVDVIIKSGSYPLRNVPIAASNREFRNAATVGSCVEVTKSPVGQFSVTGRAKVMPGSRRVKSVLITNLATGIGFTQGFKIDQGSSTGWNTGQNDNEANLGTEVDTTETFSIRTLTYSEITPYGSIAYGMTELTQSAIP